MLWERGGQAIARPRRRPQPPLLLITAYLSHQLV
jgi:hypothetical protein